MRVKGNTISLLIAISLLLLILVFSSARMANNILDKAVLAYGLVNKMNSNLTNPTTPENILPKKMHVGDIDILLE